MSIAEAEVAADHLLFANEDAVIDPIFLTQRQVAYKVGKGVLAQSVLIHDSANPPSPFRTKGPASANTDWSILICALPVTCHG